MEPILDTITVLIFLGVAQALFLGFFFLSPRQALLSNRYLGLFLFALAAIILEMMLGYSGYITRVIHLVDFSEPMNFLLGPLLYLSIHTRIHGDRPFRVHQLVHFVPFVLYGLYHVPYMLQSAEFKQAVWVEAWRDPQAGGGPRPTMDIDPLGLRAIVTPLTLVHVAAYTGAAIWQLRGSFQQQGASLWRRVGGELGWCRTFLLLASLPGLVVVVVKLAFPNDLGDHLVALSMTAVIYSTSASVIRSSSVLTGSAARAGRKYEKSTLTAEQSQAVLARLSQVMAEQKPYLQPSLTLGDLARLVSVSSHHLSQVLNEAAGISFRDYLAQHRIEEAKRLLSGPDRDELRIEDVAERVGYYSKSTFNTTFRRLTGVTPSQYRSTAAR